MTMEDGKKSRWSYSQFERMIIPGWLFAPGYEELRRLAVITYPTVLFAIAALIIFSGVRFLQDDYVQGFSDLSMALVLIGILLYYQKAKAPYIYPPIVFGVTVYGVFCIYLFFFSEIGRVSYLWSYTFPLMVFPFLGSRRGGIAVILFLLSISLLLILDPFFPFMTSYSQGFAVSFIPTIYTVSGLSFLYERNREKNQQQLNQANMALQRSNEEMEQQIQERTSELARSEGNYRFLTERMSDIVWTVDLNLEITYVSPSVTRMLGFTPEEYGRLPFHERVTPASFKESMAMLASEIEKEKIRASDPERHLQVEVEFYHKDGSIVWMESIINGIRDNEGNLAGIHGVSRDITKRKAAERELIASEERFRDLFENSTDFICTHDLQGNLLSINSTAAKSMGYSADEVIGMNIRASLKPEHRHQFDEYLKEIKKTGASKGLLAVRTRDGVEKILEYSNSLRTEGVDEPLVRGIARDITDQWRTRMALKDSEEKYRCVVENAEDAIIIVQDGIIRFVNPAVCKISGYEIHELINIPFIDLVPPDDRSSLMDIYQAYMKGDQSSDYYECRGVTKEGKERCLDVKPVIIDWEGRPALLAFVCDVSEHKLLEAQLQQAQKMEAIGTLAGGIAHDFNNLLSGILGHASLLEMENETTENQKERLHVIEELVKSASNLTSQLLGFARMGRYQVKTTDIKEVLDKISDMFGRTHKEIVIHKKYADDLLPIEADYTQMEQVFINLFVNSWQAMPGGGMIYLDASNMTVHDSDSRTSYMTPGAYVKITVTDTGSGMDAATKIRIFEPFFTTKEMGRGTGLGLAMVYGIVKGHNGHINVYSEKGHGTTFKIYLPASEKTLVNEKEKTKVKLVKGTETFLIVDDEQELIDVTGDILCNLGYKIYAARNGEEAIEIYRRQKDEIDLVILDLIMPGMGGGETFNRLRDINPDIKVILSSGYSLDGQAREVMDKGCRAFIQKPAGASILSQKVREVLDNT